MGCCSSSPDGDEGDEVDADDVADDDDGDADGEDGIWPCLEVMPNEDTSNLTPLPANFPARAAAAP
jgi:hypothetical protein